MKTAKKAASTFVIAITLFSFTGCFEDAPEDTTPSTSTDYLIHETTDFTIDYGKNLEVLTPENFPSNVPKSTVVIFRNNIKSDVFTANLNISQSALKTDISSTDFALQTLNTEKYNLVSFQEVARETYTLASSTDPTKTIDTFLVTFRGRKSVTEPLLEWKQLCFARNGYGIIVTTGYLPTEDQNVVLLFDTMLKSFRLKNL